MHILETEAFSSTFGKKSQRKKPKLASQSLSELVQSSEKQQEEYAFEKDSSLLSNIELDYVDEAKESVFTKGQSKRIYGELYKVIDCSDVVLHVLDARDPLGTRCRNIEKYVKNEAPHKHFIFVLNKCDLVPTTVTVSIYYESI